MKSLKQVFISIMLVYWSMHGHLLHFVWVVFKCMLVLFSPVTLRVSVLFCDLFKFLQLFLASLPCYPTPSPALSPFSPSYRGPWGTAESSERVRLSYIRFCFAKQDIHISNQSQLGLGDILNIHMIFFWSFYWWIQLINIANHCNILYVTFKIDKDVYL